MKNLKMTKNCLNPKCQKEFTPKNAKGVYCSGNCRAAHAYQMKSGKVFKMNVSHIFGIVNIDETGKVTPIKTLEELKTYVVGDADLSKYKHIFDEKPVASNTMEVTRDRIFMFSENGISEPTNEAIQKQIDEIRKEKIPENRNTIYGRKTWELDQNKRINELKKLLK